MTDLWAAPPQQITLLENEVHAWKAPLVASEDEYRAFQQVLPPTEQERARRFYFEKDRRRWIIAHGILRLLLARYLHTAPQEPQFITNEYGKPTLAPPLAKSGLQFNLSHSAKMALYAFTYRRQIGIDLEYMRRDIEWDLLARSHFSASEYATLQTLPTQLQTEAFFLCWSRKESYIKAKGKGLSIPLAQFDVSLAPGAPAKLLGSREEEGATEHWSMHALVPATDYAGALTVEGTGWSLRCWEWNSQR